MKKQIKFIAILISIAVVTLSLTGCGPFGGGNDDDTFQIGIIQLTEHPALDAAREGFLEALREEGVEFTYDLQNGQADVATLSTIAQRFANNEVDLVLAIGTPAAQAMAAETGDIPIVGTAITSYTRAELVLSDEEPGFNVTGASDMNPIAAQLGMISEFVDGVETIGLLYSSNEANSVYQAEIAKEVIAELGLEVDEATITTTGDLQQVATSLAARVDAIYIPTDNTIADAMGVVQQVSIEAGVPVFAAEENMIMGGGLATLSINYFELGKQSGRMAAQILRDGALPATMPIQFAEEEDLNYVINGFMAEALGIDIPDRFAEYIRMPEDD